MTDQTSELLALAAHGGAHLPSVEVDSYNVEIRDDEGFVGDRITRAAFCDFFDDLRKLLRKHGEDPLGDEPTDDLSKKKLDKLLAGEPAAAGVVQGSVERFARAVTLAIPGFTKVKAGNLTECVA